MVTSFTFDAGLRRTSGSRANSTCPVSTSATIIPVRAEAMGPEERIPRSAASSSFSAAASGLAGSADRAWVAMAARKSARTVRESAQGRRRVVTMLPLPENGRELRVARRTASIRSDRESFTGGREQNRSDARGNSITH